MITYEKTEEIRSVFAALQGDHLLSNRTRVAAVIFGSILAGGMALIFGIGAYKFLRSGQLIAGLGFAAVAIGVFAWGQWMQRLILTTRYQFAGGTASYSAFPNRSWSVSQDALDCIELIPVRGSTVLRLVGMDGKPHLIQLSPDMEKAFRHSGLWPRND